MKTKVRETLEKHNMLQSGAAVIVGLSGGADSVALAHCLYSLSEAYNISLLAAHVNHCLRGEEADSDEASVRDFCARYNIPLKVLKIDVHSLARQSGEGTEECGRRVRYAFFEELSEDFENAKIATAHTLSDSIETVLFHIARGSGLKGLVGIPPVRGNIIRPLINCTREEIEKYCADNALSFVTDSTNADTVYARNYVRHLIVPHFYHLNPAFDKAAGRLQSALSEDEAYLSLTARAELEGLTVSAGKYDAEKLKRLHPAILNRVIFLILQENSGFEADSCQIKKMQKVIFSGGAEQLSGEKFVRVRKRRLEFYVKTDEDKSFNQEIFVGMNELSSGTLKITVYNDKNSLKKQFVNKNLLTNVIDCDKIIGKMIVRTRQAGDSYRLFSGGCTKTLKKLYNEKGIAPEKRSVIPVVCDDCGIVWVYGCGCAQRCAVSDETEKAFLLDFEEI